MPIDTIVFGELALSGEVRPVAHGGLRLREAAKLGFDRALIPSGGAADAGAISTQNFRTLGQFVDHMLARG